MFNGETPKPKRLLWLLAAFASVTVPVVGAVTPGIEGTSVAAYETLAIADNANALVNKTFFIVLSPI